MKTLVGGVVCLAAMAGVVGCVGITRPKGPPKDYSLQELVTMAEQNQSGLDRFRSKGGRMSGNIPTDKGNRHYDVDGVAVRYEKPRDMLLTGTVLGKPAVQIGSNPEHYWLATFNDPNTLYWGDWAYAEHKRNPWRMAGPVKIMEALGQVNFRSGNGSTGGPGLVRTADGNILQYRSGTPPHVTKEIYLTRYEPIVVSKIVYYDPSGAEEVRMLFADHQPLAGGAWMAKKIDLVWPKENRDLKLRLGKVIPGETHPEGAFVLPDPATFEQQEQVDRECR